jgi:dTMP kinase
MFSEMKRKGKFITLEGPEGCGKSTHAVLLFNFLLKKGYHCIFTREPGGTLIGEEIRRVLLDPKNRGMNPICETLLFEASRATLVEKVIRPSLEKGYVVICDRFSDATLVYQGYAGKQDLKKLRIIDKYATRGIKPDLTVVLDIPAKEGLKRTKKSSHRKKKLFKWDRMERKSLAFHNAVRNGYLRLARRERKRIKVIKTQEDINKTQGLIRREVLRII